MLQIRDFTSPHTIRVEAGLSSMMEQYDRNFKVRQIMGSRASFKGNAGSTASKVSTGSSESAGTLANEARAPERPGKPPSNKRWEHSECSGQFDIMKYNIMQCHATQKARASRGREAPNKRIYRQG